MAIKMTKSGICYDLPNTPYKITFGKYTLHFSSQRHMDTFMARRQEQRTAVAYAMMRRYGVDINIPVIADIDLYRRVESRGFCLTVEGGEMFTCLRSLKLSGHPLLLKDSMRQ